MPHKTLHHVDADHDILQTLTDHGAASPAYLHTHIDTDISKPYLRERLRELMEMGLVTRTGRGVYKATGAGEVAANHSEMWAHKRDRYREIVDEVREQPDR